MKQNTKQEKWFGVSNINSIIMKNCQNCGHSCHCGTNCLQTHKDGDGNDIQINCCSNCRCDSYIDEEKYNIES